MKGLKIKEGRLKHEDEIKEQYEFLKGIRAPGWSYEDYLREIYSDHIIEVKEGEEDKKEVKEDKVESKEETSKNKEERLKTQNPDKNKKNIENPDNPNFKKDQKIISD